MSVEVAAGEVARPLWRRSRFWLALGAVLVVGAVLVAVLGPRSRAALDPDSAAKSGGRALAQLLRGYGVRVERSSDIADVIGGGPDDTVLVAYPDAYSPSQLTLMKNTSARLVVLDPSPAALEALLPEAVGNPAVTGVVHPACDDPGAVASGPVDFGSGATTYGAAGEAMRCYAGAVLFAEDVAVLGSSELLRNDRLSREGVAALDVNLLSVDRTKQRVVWLMPGSDAGGTPHVKSVWDLFPRGAHRAFLWLLLTGLVVVLWRARRLGPPVTEPLPVVVRAAEVVEGHGRLYRRARARASAAAALRAGTTSRLARHLGLPRPATSIEVAPVAAGAVGRDPVSVGHLLAGPPPVDDRELRRLATDLQELEQAAGVPPEGKGKR